MNVNQPNKIKDETVKQKKGKFILTNLFIYFHFKSKEKINSKKKLTEFSCYLKIERNGISYHSKFFNPFGLQILVVYDEEITSENITYNKRAIYLNSANNENIFTFEVKNIEKIVDKLVSEGKVTLMVNLNQKNISNTDLNNSNNNFNSSNSACAINKNPSNNTVGFGFNNNNQANSLKQNYEMENYIIFISQSTNEILENFLKYIKNYNSKNRLIQNNNNNIIMNKTQADANKNNPNKNNKLNLEYKSTNNPNNNSRLWQKRKYQEFYQQYQNKNNPTTTDKTISSSSTSGNISLSHNTSLANKLNNILNNKSLSLTNTIKDNNYIIKNKIQTASNKSNNTITINNNKNNNNKTNKFTINKIPDVVLSEIFCFLDKESSNNFSLVNKQLIKIHDGFKENLELRADTPADMFSSILTRFENLRKLKFGKGKKIKNEVFKNLNSNLKSLIALDISEIDNLNENSITKILSKTKPSEILSLKINFDINCLNPVLSYILRFTLKLEELSIESLNGAYYLKNKEEGENLVNLLTLAKVASVQYHTLLLDILSKKLYLKEFGVFIFNMAVVKGIIAEEGGNRYYGIAAGKCEKEDNDFENKNKNLSSNEINFDGNNNNTNYYYKYNNNNNLTNYDFQNCFGQGNINKINSLGYADVFSNLKILNFDILIIKKIQDLLLLKNAINLEELTIQNILLLEVPKTTSSTINNKSNNNKSNNTNNKIDLFNAKLTKINFKNFQLNIEEIEKNLNSNFNYINNNLSNIINLNNNEQQAENGAEAAEEKMDLENNENKNQIKIMENIDLEEDYVEIFIQVFSGIRFLKKIEFGEFINGEILKVICNFSKKISVVKLKSNFLADEDVNYLLRKMAHLESLDLRGCMNIYGNCFVELDKLPEKLKKVKLSLQTFNFYNLIDYLRKNNIEAQNYI